MQREEIGVSMIHASKSFWHIFLHKYKYLCMFGGH